ncbi:MULTISPECIES: hypothetical protein [unclassified Stenotrophomonas]|uniref:hypothetical protein n=1 Tax=unclassified Stenotrophomonas TaxID=196198 RepID=UPI0017827E37|nr:MULTISPECIES: hypothetical protein [unclassified Stenotrophomonas]MBD8636640.1 hypothetical protein [Stenotrophomonas sp. CFBP 13725]MBD8696823.1 hypothetical protein [Stenotrophomonas sp. CFBP 13718]
MNQPIEQILERLARCELELQASRGYIKALEYGLQAVIASHPTPAALAELWSHVLPEVADVHGGDGSSSPLFDAAFQQALAGLSDHIQGAADRQAGSAEQV